MEKLPHHYHVTATANETDEVLLSSRGAPDLSTTPPPEFGGPEGHWSPETMLVGAVANCYIFTFKAIARASKLEWSKLTCDVEGVLAKEDSGMRFTEMVVRPKLWLADGARESIAERVMEKAEEHCLVSNSLNATVKLEAQIAADADPHL